MARRATAIQQAREQAPVLLLDAGNTLLGQNLADATKGQAMVEAMNLMGYDAMALGDRELFLEMDDLLARAREAQFPILSANVVLKDTGQPLLAPYAIVEVAGLRVGILGLTNANAGDFATPYRELGAMSASLRDQVEILDPVEAARRYLPEIASEADLVIALSRLGVQGNAHLAREVPGIAVIVSGGSRQLLTQPVQEEETLIVQAGYDGEYLGSLGLEMEPTGQVVAYEGRVIALTDAYADDRDMARWLSQQKRAAGF